MPRFLQNRALILMGAFGFVAGLPLPLSGFTLRQWLSESGTSLEAIGFTASIGLAYTLKFLWSPMLDQARPPAGLARFGRRRGWLLTIQPLLALACLALALSNPARGPELLIAVAATIAFLSASQDIVIDAWRIETFPERMQGLALASYVWGYRIALLVSGAGAIAFANVVGWRGSLITMAVLAGMGGLVTLLAAEPVLREAAGRAAGFLAQFRTAVVDPLRDFWARPGAPQILAFVMLFKLGEALAHTMAVPFYRDLGFDRAQVAWATGVPGLAASLLGAAAGGWLLVRIGTGRALISTGFVQMASMGLYFALAVSGGDGRILLAKVVLESFAEAMADAAFLTYLSSLCSSAFTATQYALLSSLAAVGLRTLGGLSGILAAHLGWTGFYALTIFAALPAMMLMVGLLRRFPPPSARAQEA
ncbi:MAG: MFS transporter [Acetobacteraceae bacterium]|nr:MFS transporter [Acetobacteraceae bacterium]